jgi:hypothetical protein
VARGGGRRIWIAAAPPVGSAPAPAPTPEEHHRPGGRRNAKHRSAHAEGGAPAKAGSSLAEPSSDESRPPPADSGDGELLLPFRER